MSRKLKDEYIKDCVNLDNRVKDQRREIAQLSKLLDRRMIAVGFVGLVIGIVAGLLI